MKYTEFNPKTMNIISYCEHTGNIKVFDRKKDGEFLLTLPKWITTIMKWEYTRGQADKMQEIKRSLGISQY